MQALHDRRLPAAEVRALASARSGEEAAVPGCGQVPAGELICAGDDAESFEGVDIALFSCSASGRRWRGCGCAPAVMIDNSSVFACNEDVPLRCPRWNPGDVARHNGGSRTRTAPPSDGGGVEAPVSICRASSAQEVHVSGGQRRRRLAKWPSCTTT